MRLALPLAIAAVATLLLAGCGASGEETTGAPEPLQRNDAGASSAPIGASVRSCPTDGVWHLRASGVDCERAFLVMSNWNFPRCRPAKGESRSACTVRHYRCLAVKTDRGAAVNCARSGRSISFRWRP